MGGRPASGPAAPAWWQRGAVYGYDVADACDADPLLVLSTDPERADGEAPSTLQRAEGVLLRLPS